MRYIRDIFGKQTATLLSWLICKSIDLMLIITQLKTLELYRDQYRTATSVDWGEAKPLATPFTFTEDWSINMSFDHFTLRKICRDIGERNHLTAIMEDIHIN